MTDIFANITNTKKQYDPERAVVAYSPQCSQMSLIWSTPFMAQDFRETSTDPLDALGEAPGPGLWIWEGQLHEVVYHATPDHATEYDVDYNGEFRRPTPDEWEAIMMAKPPFDITDPNAPTPLANLMEGLAELGAHAHRDAWAKRADVLEHSSRMTVDVDPDQDDPRETSTTPPRKVP